MTVATAHELVRKECPDEDELELIKRTEALAQLKKLPGWRMTHAGKSIRKDWVVKDFAAGLEFFDRVGKVAEQEYHHPDLHLEGFRNVWIELSTHALGGLSESDFIMAAKIDQLPIQRKQAKS